MPEATPPYPFSKTRLWCVCVLVCVGVCVCVRVGSWLVDSLHTVHGARLVTRQALLHSIANTTTAAKK